jgi:hypothetical protein
MLQFTTWFKCASLEMKSFEILTRASCCLVTSSQGSLHLLASQHVTHPHTFRHYYPSQSYLAAVRDSDLRYSVEVCEDGTGTVLARHRLPASLALHRHNSRDLSIVSGEGLSALQGALGQAAGPALLPLGLHPAGSSDPEGGAPLTLSGHFLHGSGAEGVMLPRRIAGEVAQRSASQLFLRTAAVLEMGMCGGPVTVDGARGDQALLGIVEGIVPLHRPEEEGALTPLQSKARQLLGGTAVIVEAADIRRMLAQV